MSLAEALEKLGAAHVARACKPDTLDQIEQAIKDLPQKRAGVRITANAGLDPIISTTGAIGLLAARVLGPMAKPVRAILFDKSAASNWALGWHQDRVIVVKQRHSAPGFGPWTIKAGLHHVAPPFWLLEAMVTIRIHLDPVTADNAPLLVALGSHRLGLVAETDVDPVVATSEIHQCLAERGDAWLYATPILHASARSTAVSRRRVLQIDYCAENLPGGLEWLGI